MEGALFSVIPPNSSHTKYIDPWKLQVTHGDSKGVKPFLVSPTCIREFKSEKEAHKSCKGQRSVKYQVMKQESTQNVKKPRRTSSKYIFRPTSPPKKGFQGTGAHYGTFNSKPFDHVTINVSGCRTRTKITTYQPRNVVTSPPREKGPGLTPKICFGELEYVSPGSIDPDPVEHAKRLKAKLSEKPFVVRADDLLSKPLPESPFEKALRKREHAHSTPNSPYRSPGATAASLSLSRPHSAPHIHPPTSAHAGHAEVFRPCSPQTPQATLSGTFGSYPKHVVDPYDDKKGKFATMPDRSIPVVALKNSKELHKVRSSWRPAKVPGTLPSPSIVKMIRSRRGR